MAEHSGEGTAYGKATGTHLAYTSLENFTERKEPVRSYPKAEVRLADRCHSPQAQVTAQDWHSEAWSVFPNPHPGLLATGV